MRLPSFLSRRPQAPSLWADGKGRTPNWFLGPHRFVSAAAWCDPAAGILLWPSVWVEWGREPSLDVRVHRVIGGFGSWRVQLNLGRWNPVDPDGPLDWSRLAIDGYLKWAQQMFSRKWVRLDVERLFQREPAWRRLAILGTTRNHYVRVVLARAMLETNGTGLGGNAELAEALGGQEAFVHAGPADSKTAVESSFLDGLDQLGERLRRPTDATEP